MANTNMTVTLFIILVLIPTEFFLVTFATTNETDIQALLDVKKHIQNDPFDVLNSWNDSIHFCNWQGITCGKRHKRVTILDVSSLGLVGTLSPYVGNLSFLVKISLSNNSFSGTIPQEIGRLFRLQHLAFANNYFQDQFPLNLTLCRNLRSIQLFGNSLSGRIPDEVGVLYNLYSFVLRRNNFTGNIPPSLGNISTLVLIDLSENNLNGNIPHELGKLFNLQILSLGMNKLRGSFPFEISNISSIQIISIPLNYLTGQFPDTLGLTLQKMTQFLIGSNNFSGSIPSTLSNASNLVNIDMGDNMLTGPIPKNLGKLRKLRWLEFANNPLGIDSENNLSFISTLTNCTELVLLELSGIEIGGILPLQISNLSRNLKHFSLNDNHISGNLPNEIENLVGLNVFAIKGNILSGNIPPSIGKLINMKNLFLFDNNFIGEIPPSIGDISGLLILNLEGNMLTGSIPHSISNLTKLEILNLAANNLNGTLPKEVFSRNSLLLGLFLGLNKFSGSIPSEVGNLKHLISLYVLENELSGNIPISLGDCQMLAFLLMEGNVLDGTIPSSFGNLINMDAMDLSRNKLSGKIPPSLENMKSISSLNLSFNKLEGEVPNNGVFVNATALSLVGNENLCGGLKSFNLPVCPSKDINKHGKLPTHIVIILIICISLAIVSLFVSIYAIYNRHKSERLHTSTSPCDYKLLKISYAEILSSTDGFSLENLIGEGKYGAVYRGVLKPEEKVIAVKVLKLQLKGAYKSFLAECESLKNIRHRNLIKIITTCSSIDFKGNDFKALILEYVSNGSLEQWLHENPFVHVNEKKLDLLERLNIAIDVAKALDYLHNHSRNPIVHCDIKPSNVLLGDDLRGLVSDFGLAKFLPMTNDTTHDIESISNGIGIRGTIGYIAPEYGMGSDVSTKGDVYSYGILLLEMFTGKRPTNAMFTEDFNLHNYVKAALHHRVVKIIDQELLTEEYKKMKTSRYTSTIIESCCLSIFRVGVSCSSAMKNERMGIKDALNELQHVRNELG